MFRTEKKYKGETGGVCYKKMANMNQMCAFPTNSLQWALFSLLETQSSNTQGRSCNVQFKNHIYCQFVRHNLW